MGKPKAGFSNLVLSKNSMIPGVSGKQISANTPNNILGSQNVNGQKLHSDNAHLSFKRKIRMNSEEKLMANKVAQANNAMIFTKKSDKKYVRLGSGNERKQKNKHSIAKSSNLYSNNDPDSSTHKYRKSSRSSNRRIGSPVTDRNEHSGDENAYYEKKQKVKMAKKNLKLDPDNVKMQPLNQYPFPLTPVDNASNKLIEPDENIVQVKSQSTRNK